MFLLVSIRKVSAAAWTRARLSRVNPRKASNSVQQMDVNNGTSPYDSGWMWEGPSENCLSLCALLQLLL